MAFAGLPTMKRWGDGVWGFLLVLIFADMGHVLGLTMGGGTMAADRLSFTC